jgi:hypothetical protein
VSTAVCTQTCILTAACKSHSLLRCMQIGNDNFYEVLSKIRGPDAVAEWRQLQEVMRPLAKAAVLMPPVAFRWGQCVTQFYLGRNVTLAMANMPKCIPRLYQSWHTAAQTCVHASCIVTTGTKPCGCHTVCTFGWVAVCRYDPGVLLSAIGRYLPQLASGGTDAMKLTGPFSKVCPQ